jgi:hypothetical protein
MRAHPGGRAEVGRKGWVGGCRAGRVTPWVAPRGGKGHAQRTHAATAACPPAARRPALPSPPPPNGAPGDPHAEVAQPAPKLKHLRRPPPPSMEARSGAGGMSSVGPRNARSRPHRAGPAPSCWPRAPCSPQSPLPGPHPLAAQPVPPLLLEVLRQAGGGGTRGGALCGARAGGPLMPPRCTGHRRGGPRPPRVAPKLPGPPTRTPTAHPPAWRSVSHLQKNEGCCPEDGSILKLLWSGEAQ